MKALSTCLTEFLGRQWLPRTIEVKRAPARVVSPVISGDVFTWSDELMAYESSVRDCVILAHEVRRGWLRAYGPVVCQHLDLLEVVA